MIMQWPLPSQRVSEYDQEIPQSHTAAKPMAPKRRATVKSQDTRKTNQAKQLTLSSLSRWLQNKTDIKFKLRSRIS